MGDDINVMTSVLFTELYVELEMLKKKKSQSDFESGQAHVFVENNFFSSFNDECVSGKTKRMKLHQMLNCSLDIQYLNS